MITLFYILGKGSLNNNEELKYSLRTVEKWIVGKYKIVVVGEDCGFLSDKVEYHFCPEFNGNKEFRIAKKIEWACKKGILKGDFFFMNDDFFFTTFVNPLEYPFYYKGLLSEKAPNKSYEKSLHNTFEYLTKNGYDALHFDVHTPIIYNAEKFIKLEKVWNYSQTLENGLVVKSIYSNIYNVQPQIQYTDVKLFQWDESRIKTTNCFSCSDGGWTNGVRDYLKRNYPTKSKYEK